MGRGRRRGDIEIVAGQESPPYIYGHKHARVRVRYILTLSPEILKHSPRRGYNH